MILSGFNRLPLYLRYIGVSAVALAVDMAIFLALIPGGTTPTFAAGIGYAAGIVVHWYLSSRLVFARQVAANDLARTNQKILFVTSALCGLGLTIAIVGGCTALGVDARIAKISAIAVSFNATYLLRKLIVFA